jgi:aldehyde:ferredoxin oxidoreductase
MKKTVRINTKTKEIASYPGMFFNKGGRMLTSHVITSEVNPRAEPLGAGNKLVIAGMLPAGTTISSTYRLSIGFKSPLTGGIKESNVGGMPGYYLHGQGIKAIILEDKPEKDECNILVIAKDGSISFEDASDLKGKGTYETEEILRNKFGKDIGILSVGPAGERGYLNSAIMATEMGIERPCRAAARGGGGAVMASKGIKAIVVHKADNPYEVVVADKEAYARLSKIVNEAIMKDNPFSAGTVVLMSHVASGISPYRNFSGAVPPQEEQDRYNVQTITGRMQEHGGKVGHACMPGCLVQCSNAVHDKDGNFLTGGFEYETIELAGTNCGISDVDVVANIDRFCDDFGFDTIEFAVTLSTYMDCGKMAWGDNDAVLKLLKTIRKDASVADDFGLGAERFGKKLGAKRIPTVKGQALAAYDPRAVKGTGTSYAISTMGADHTSGPTLDNTRLVHHEKKGNLEYSVQLQSIMLAADSNMCIFAWGNAMKVGGEYTRALTAALGQTINRKIIFTTAMDMLKREVTFNRLAGIGTEHDKLPEFFYNEQSVPTGSVYDITPEEINEKWHKLVG